MRRQARELLLTSPRLFSCYNFCSSLDAVAVPTGLLFRGSKGFPFLPGALHLKGILKKKTACVTLRLNSKGVAISEEILSPCVALSGSAVLLRARAAGGGLVARQVARQVAR